MLTYARVIEVVDIVDKEGSFEPFGALTSGEKRGGILPWVEHGAVEQGCQVGVESDDEQNCEEHHRPQSEHSVHVEHHPILDSSPGIFLFIQGLQGAQHDQQTPHDEEGVDGQGPVHDDLKQEVLGFVRDEKRVVSDGKRRVLNGVAYDYPSQ